VHGHASVREQQRQQRKGSAARHAGDPAISQADLDRTQDPELPVHLSSEPIRRVPIRRVKALRK
jgi:hypothetical protein